MDKKTQFLRRLPVIIGVICALVIGVGVYFLQSMFEKPAKAKKQIQQITMIQPPPPPPPPPPVQKPPEPEPEKIPEPEKEPEPEPQPEEAPEPQSDQLGVDADGAAGSNGFGLVGKKGGAGLLGGSGGSTILWYGGLVKRGLESGLQNALEGAARESSYSVQINIWINASGRVERAELSSSSGNAEVDSEIRSALPKLHFTLEKAPPENMPQPLKIRVTSRL